MPEKAVLIGAGNLAWHLAPALDRAGIVIDQVIATNPLRAKELAGKFGAYFGTECVSGSKVEWIFICTGDNQIEAVAEKFSSYGEIMVHSSGSTSIEVISSHNRHAAVLYPLQTLHKDRKIDFNKIPLLIEASDSSTEQKIRLLAEKLSSQVQFVNSENRRLVHLAAVITNNFTNHLMQQAENIMDFSGLPTQWLYPLLAETVAKASAMGAKNAQTGPAKRGDLQTIATHLEWLSLHQPNLAKIYKEISMSILREYKDGDDLENI
jgi:predicted short-subunit dehydrogenase-like oxidoreductase (DUF2520 family)